MELPFDVGDGRVDHGLQRCRYLPEYRWVGESASQAVNEIHRKQICSEVARLSSKISKGQSDKIPKCQLQQPNQSNQMKPGVRIHIQKKPNQGYWFGIPSGPVE